MATDVSAPFPAVELPPNSTLTVTLSDAGAKVTAMNVHGWQEESDVGASGLSPATGAYLYGEAA